MLLGRLGLSVFTGEREHRNRVLRSRFRPESRIVCLLPTLLKKRERRASRIRPVVTRQAPRQQSAPIRLWNQDGLR